MRHSGSTVCEGIDTSKPYEHKTVDYVSYAIEIEAYFVAHKA